MIRQKYGFTLIELSIVIVIIALVAGGVLVGRDLIQSSQIRGVVSQIDEYKAAYHTFKLKYGCIPGDCATATRFGFTSGYTNMANAANGDGDGLISSYLTSPTLPNSLGGFVETWNVNYQLYQAKLVSQAMINIIRSYLKTGKGGIYMTSFRPFFTPNGTGNFIVMAGYPLNGNDFAASDGEPFTPAQALAIDIKMDDGFPMTGTMLATATNRYVCLTSANRPAPTPPRPDGPCFNYPSANSSPGYNLTNSCIDDTVTPSIYNIASRTSLLCSLHAPVN